MRKRLAKKLKEKQKYELSKLEELIILAHRINLFEEGCVFIYDQGHVSSLEIVIAENKTFFHQKIGRFETYYDEDEHLLFPQDYKQIKRKLIELYEELDEKSHSAEK